MSRPPTHERISAEQMEQIVAVAMPIIFSVSDLRKAEMACELNRWQIPLELAPLKPADWNDWAYCHPDASALIGRLMDFIETLVSKQYVNRIWNRERMTDEEHAAWWAKREAEGWAMSEVQREILLAVGQAAERGEGMPGDQLRDLVGVNKTNPQ